MSDTDLNELLAKAHAHYDQMLRTMHSFRPLGKHGNRFYGETREFAQTLSRFVLFAGLSSNKSLESTLSDLNDVTPEINQDVSRYSGLFESEHDRIVAKGREALRLMHDILRGLSTSGTSSRGTRVAVD